MRRILHFKWGVNSFFTAPIPAPGHMDFYPFSQFSGLFRCFFFQIFLGEGPQTPLWEISFDNIKEVQLHSKPSALHTSYSVACASYLLFNYLKVKCIVNHNFMISQIHIHISNTLYKAVR